MSVQIINSGQLQEQVAVYNVNEPTERDHVFVQGSGRVTLQAGWDVVKQRNLVRKHLQISGSALPEAADPVVAAAAEAAPETESAVSSAESETAN